MFEIKNVSKKFGEEFALRDISMTMGKGLNFIIGVSGSGKTTLLKIISAMEQDFQGEILFCGQDIKIMGDEEKSYFYNNVFGFIWQDFNLLEDFTVLENIMVPQYLKNDQDQKSVMKILRELKISGLADKKVKQLSGGEKQRVAIARELIKNPQVIIADEPTSALDEKSAKIIMEILRDISKTRTVIVVTHDTSLIDSNSKVYELDKGELISKSEEIISKTFLPKKKGNHKLTFKNAWAAARTSIKSKWGRFAATALSLLVAANLLLVTVSGAITDSSQSAFDDLFDTYGDSILDISVVGSFISAGGTDGKEKDEPNADVTQDIGGLYDKYVKDERVEHSVFLQAFNNIKVTINGKEYAIEGTNSVPFINKLTAGTMPIGSGKEVVVPNSFVKKLGITDDEALGKTLNFNSAIYNWESGEPVLKNIGTTATIVGVIDTTVIYDYEGEKITSTVDDSFFFSRSALDHMRREAGIMGENINFSIRAKTPADMIAIKDELNAMGIVPLGRFELVEDMVRLNDQTKEQSGSAMIVIGVLSVVVVIAVAFITGFMRKREYAIYKVSGYSKKHLAMLMGAESLIVSLISGGLFLIASPLMNLATTAFWKVNILNSKLLSTGVLLVIAMGALFCAIITFISSGTKMVDSLKTGDR